MNLSKLTPNNFISIHLTDLCNERCSFCVVGSPLFSKSEVADEDVWQFLSDFSGEGYQAVNLHGGEPTIYPRLTALLEYCRELGYPQIHIQTNARKLANREFARHLIDLNVTLFIVSLHSPDADTSDALTLTPGGWKETVEGINNIRALGAEVRTNIVLMKQNISQLEEYARLLAMLDVRYANISSLHPVGSAFFSFQLLTPSFHEVRFHLYKSIEMMESVGINVSLEGFPPCVVPEYSHLHIEQLGREIPLLHKSLIIDSYDGMMDDGRIKRAKCSECILNQICGGVYKEYIEYRGWEEFNPVQCNM